MFSRTLLMVEEMMLSNIFCFDIDEILNIILIKFINHHLIFFSSALCYFHSLAFCVWGLRLLQLRSEKELWNHTFYSESTLPSYIIANYVQYGWCDFAIVLLYCYFVHFIEDVVEKNLEGMLYDYDFFVHIKWGIEFANFPTSWFAWMIFFIFP